MTTYQIISSFPTLAAAVAATGFDLSYNQAEGEAEVRRIDNPPPRAKELGITAPTKVFSVAGEKVPELYMVYGADGLRFIKKFTPFISVLSNRNLTVAIVDEAGGNIWFTAANFSNDQQGRAEALHFCQENPAVCLF